MAVHWERFESPAYWIAFSAAFLAVAAWESAQPLRPLASSGRRWGAHGMLLLVGVICSGWVLRLSPVLAAIGADGSRYGLLNRSSTPTWLRFAATILLLDLLQYGIHRLFHAVLPLWRIHEVHHSDAGYDVSTAGRFHPGEVFITQGLFLAGVVLLAPPAVAVLASEILATVLNLFVHANKSLPEPVEKVLRWIFVTPTLHRIHHSDDFAEQNRNYGQTFPWWDRLFGTYAPAAAQGEPGMAFGLRELSGTDTTRVLYMLAEPFHRRAARPHSPELPEPE